MLHPRYGGFPAPDAFLKLRMKIKASSLSSQTHSRTRASCVVILFLARPAFKEPGTRRFRAKLLHKRRILPTRTWLENSHRDAAASSRHHTGPAGNATVKVNRSVCFGTPWPQARPNGCALHPQRVAGNVLASGCVTLTAFDILLLTNSTEKCFTFLDFRSPPGNDVYLKTLPRNGGRTSKRVGAARLR